MAQCRTVQARTQAADALIARQPQPNTHTHTQWTHASASELMACAVRTDVGSDSDDGLSSAVPPLTRFFASPVPLTFSVSPGHQYSDSHSSARRRPPLPLALTALIERSASSVSEWQPPTSTAVRQGNCSKGRTSLSVRRPHRNKHTRRTLQRSSATPPQ